MKDEKKERVMGKEEMHELLDLTYELEGLLHLAILREEEQLQRLPLLVKDKIARLSALAGNPSDAIDVETEYESAPAIDDESEYESAPETTAESEDKSEYESEYSVDAEPDSEPDSGLAASGEDKPAADPDAADADGEESAVNRDLHPTAFSLNDRFLFTRELFGGSRKAFDEAVGRLAQMDSYDEAEQCFYDEYGFNPKDEVVKDFMNIVYGYLNQ